MNTFICEAGAIFIKEVMCMTNYREILRLESMCASPEIQWRCSLEGIAFVPM